MAGGSQEDDHIIDDSNPTKLQLPTRGDQAALVDLLAEDAVDVGPEGGSYGRIRNIRRPVVGRTRIVAAMKASARQDVPRPDICMNQTGTLPYIDDGNAQIVGLPLANQQLAVVVALPHGDLATYEAGLTATSAGIAMPTGSTLVQLSVPKVSFTSPTFPLKTALQTMGMPVAFDPVKADFKGLCTNPPDGDNLYNSDVLQKAMIAMQETGVEAAAATAVIVAGAEISGGPSLIPMIVNHPYLLSIVDVPTGAVLFVGHIVDPTESSGS